MSNEFQKIFKKLFRIQNQKFKGLVKSYLLVKNLKNILVNFKIIEKMKKFS